MRVMCEWVSDFSRLSASQVLTKKKTQSTSMIQHFKKRQRHCDKKRIAHRQWHNESSSQNWSFKLTSFKSFQIDRSRQQKLMKNELKKLKQSYKSSVIKRIYLWSNVKQREREIFTKKHALVIKNCLLYIQAWILSDRASKKITSWSNDIKSWLNDQIHKIWIDMIERLKTSMNNSRYRVDFIFTSHEARQISNRISQHI